MVLSAYLIYHQGPDVLYALSSGQPQALGPAPALFGPGAPALPQNRYVRIEGTPDFESAVVLDTQGEWKFRSFFRVLNTDGKLFVQRVPGPLPSSLAERNGFSGRLLPLDKISFSSAIRAYYAQHVTATHVFDPEAFRQAVEARIVPGSLPDRLGSKVALAGNEVLAFDLKTPNRFTIEIPQTHFPELAGALRALKATGANVLDAGRSVPRDGGGSGYVFEVDVSPENQRQTLSAAADLAGRVRIEPVVQTLNARLSDVASDGETLSLTPLPSNPAKAVAAQPETRPWADVTGVRTTAHLEIPADAYLLLEGERPSSHYRAVVATAFLLAFALINLLAFRRKV